MKKAKPKRVEVSEAFLRNQYKKKGNPSAPKVDKWKTRRTRQRGRFRSYPGRKEAMGINRCTIVEIAKNMAEVREDKDSIMLDDEFLEKQMGLKCKKRKS